MARRRHRKNGDFFAPVTNKRSRGLGAFSRKPPQSNHQSYGALVRRVVIFQFRLAADGIRDLLLSPISVIAALLGLLRPDNPSWAYDRLMHVGRQSDKWINLFEQEDHNAAFERGRTIDDLFDHMEREVKSRIDPETPPEKATWADTFAAAINQNRPERQ